jgi:arylsulfatase A-like enzyme
MFYNREGGLPLYKDYLLMIRANRLWRNGLCVALIAALMLSGCSGTDDGAAAKYNVLLITLDTTRRDHLGCYGYDQGREGGLTPNLDALAADGVRFDMAVSTSAATPPSHASILTGLNTYRHGVRVIYAESGYRLPDDVPFLSDILRNHSYETAAFLSSFTVSSFYGFDRGFDVFDEGLGVPAEQSMHSRSDGFWDWPLDRNQRRSDETTDRVVSWLQRVKEPFFAWVHYWDPHDTALLPPRDIVSRFVTADQDGPTKNLMAYRAEVYYMDSQFGRLIRTLQEQELYENTIIAVVADHGQGLGDHDWWHHRLLYQEQIHVPLIMRVPGWPKGEVVGDLVRTTDITPTVLDVLAVAPTAGMDGRSVSALVHGESDAPRIAYADAINLFDLNAMMVKRRPDDGLVYCATDGEWKLIHRPTLTGKDELYRIAGDPNELKNLIGMEPDQAARLKRELDRFNGYVEKPFGEELDPEVLKRLKSLGYVGDK